jgi:hypothetical protein
MASNIVRFDALRSTAFGSITNSYVALGTRFAHAMRVLNFQNTTDGDILVSFDGTTDNAIVPASSFSLYDLTSDEDANEMFRYELGTQIYIKYSTAPSKGTFYLTAIYGKGE